MECQSLIQRKESKMKVTVKKEKDSSETVAYEGVLSIEFSPYGTAYLYSDLGTFMVTVEVDLIVNIRK